MKSRTKVALFKLEEMGIITDSLKRQYGIEDEDKEIKDQTPEQKEKLKAYLKKLREPVRKVEKQLIPYDYLQQAWINECKAICKRVGKEFVVDDGNKYFFKKICQYFAGDEDFVNNNKLVKNPSLNKGLFVYGSYGFGKSLTMRAFSNVLRGYRNSFNYKSTIEIINAIERKQAARQPFELKFDAGVYCFDDLGHEKRNFGNELFSDILFQRYDLFMKSGNKTHVTSNKTMEEIKERYGTYIESRFYELFNVIAVNGIDRRKS